MADINNPQAVGFCDSNVRGLADRFASLYRDAIRAQQIFDARSLASVIPNDDSPIIDGSASDGRTPMTGAMVNAFMAGLKQFTDTLEAVDNRSRNLVLQIAPNP